ncbi:MAG: hypothetical protein AMXMBFR64_13840 [Myxococcales bacterium]
MSLTWMVEGVPRPYEVRPSRSARELDAAHRAAQPERARKDDDHPAAQAVRRARRAYADVEDQAAARQPAVTAAHIMTSPVLTLPEDASVREALALMQARAIRHVPVTSAEGALVGLVSDRDLPRLVVEPPEMPAPDSPAGAEGSAPGHLPPDLDAPLRAVMSTRLLTAPLDTPIREIAQVMVDERVSCVPVLDRDRLAGIVTSTDVLRAVVTRSPLELWA